MASIGIKDLAEHLQLSIGTVSRALNDKPDVNAATRQRVLAAATELGYVPNHSGRSLKAGATNVVGLFLASRAHGITSSNLFFMELAGGVQTALARHGLDLVMLPSSADEDPYFFLQRVIARRLVDAMIVTATQRQDRRIELLSRSGLPFVALGRTETPSGHPWIDLDFEGVARDATERLVAAGHRRIAVLLPETAENLGYVFAEAHRRVLERHGVVPNPDLIVRLEASEQGGVAAAHRLLDLAPAPTAVLMTDAQMAIGLYHGLAQRNLVPGRDLAVVAFRESRQTRFLTPSLTCYRVSPKELGEALGRSVLSALPRTRDDYADIPRELVWPMQYVGGETLAPPGHGHGQGKG